MPFESPADRAYPESMIRLIGEFSKLPGIGRRSAERLAFHVLKAEPAEAERLAAAIADLKRLVRHCEFCWNLADESPCRICADPRREAATPRPESAIYWYFGHPGT